MGIQRVTQAFPTPAVFGDGSNLRYDVGFAGGAYQATWWPPTPWALITALTYEPPLNEVWELAGYSVTLDLQAMVQGQVSAKLGQLWAFLIAEGGYSSNPNPAKVSLPPDTTTGVLLWDGPNDPLPQTINSGGTAQPSGQRTAIQGSLQLPQPIAMTPGSQIGIGLWFTPSLVTSASGNGNFGLAAVNAYYTVLFDDGRPSQPGWGQ